MKSKRPFKRKYCGQVHLPKSFPAWGKACTYCNKVNHTAEVCRKAARDKKTNKLTGEKTSSRGNETANALTLTTLDNRPTETKEVKRDHLAYALNEENNDKEWNIVLEIEGRGLKAQDVQLNMLLEKCHIHRNNMPK